MASFWLNDPFVLLHREHIVELWPAPTMATNAKLNAVTRLVVVLSIVGYLFTYTNRFLIIGGLTVAAVVVYYVFSGEKIALRENFESAPVPDQGNHTVPTTTNPMMNVLLTDYKDRPNRKPALENNEQTTAPINEKVKEKVLSKVGDARIFRGIDNELGFENSMRQFYTTPNTSIPNDQEGFSSFCYGDMISGKEGNAAALSRYNARLGQVTV